MFADMPLVPMSVMLYADALDASLNTLKRQYGKELQSHNVTFGLIEDAVRQFRAAAENFTKAR